VFANRDDPEFVPNVFCWTQSHQAFVGALPTTVHRIPLANGSYYFASEVEVHRVELMDEVAPMYEPLTDVVFHLYTQQNPKVSQIIRIDDANSLKASNFNPALPTRILVHGWIYDINLFFIQEGKDEYLKKGKFNVIGVDWSAGGGTSNYIAARGRVKSTGDVLGRFIRFLEKTGGAKLSDILPVGYSLGAHVVGCAGKYLNGELSALVGLDPAGPLFLVGASDTISAKDAQFVEIIHTNTAFNGISAAVGDVDFYPNGGANQPGCNGDNSCSHDRAPYYFIESINSNVGFTGTRCTSQAGVKPTGCDFILGSINQMGGEPLRLGSGVYFSTTNSASPFARGDLLD